MYLPESVALPLKEDAHGVIRVSGTRVSLDNIIRFYNAGESPEDLHEGFPTVPLADIYTIIAYYLSNKDVVDQYIAAVDQKAEAMRRTIEDNYTEKQKARTSYFKSLLDAKTNTA